MDPRYPLIWQPQRITWTPEGARNQRSLSRAHWSPWLKAYVADLLERHPVPDQLHSTHLITVDIDDLPTFTIHLLAVIPEPEQLTIC